MSNRIRISTQGEERRHLSLPKPNRGSHMHSISKSAQADFFHTDGFTDAGPLRPEWSDTLQSYISYVSWVRVRKIRKSSKNPYICSCFFRGTVLLQAMILESHSNLSPVLSEDDQPKSTMQHGVVDREGRALVDRHGGS